MPSNTCVHVYNFARKNALQLLLPWGWSDWVVKNRRGRVTSRLGRALDSWGIVGNPSLVTCHLFFISLLIHIGLAHFCPARFLKHKDFRVCARPDYRPKVFWKCLLIDMRHPGLAGLYKSAGLRKKVTRRSSFHAVNPHFHRFDTQPTKIMVFSQIWKLIIMIIKQFRSKAKRCDTVTAFDDGCCMKQFCFREGNNFFSGISPLYGEGGVLNKILLWKHVFGQKNLLFGEKRHFES